MGARIAVSHVPSSGDLTGSALAVSPPTAGRRLAVCRRWSWTPRNGHGELGNNSHAYSPIPVDVVGLSSGVVGVSTGYWSTCTLTADGAEDRADRRVELCMFDQEYDGPRWAQRARIAEYPRLQLLSLRSNRLTGPLGIDLGALPRLEYLSISENLLERVPPEIRSCRSLIHLDLRDNRLRSIEATELPSSLRWLDISQNMLSEAMVARVRAALPDCEVQSYAQRPG